MDMDVKRRWSASARADLASAGTVSTGGVRICRAGGEWAGFWGASGFAVKTFCL